MSKHFGSGRRMEDKGYPSRRGVEDKRPSVFDRLGVREYDDLPPSHSHYSGGDRGGGSYRRMDSPGGGMRKHSPAPMQNPMMGRRNPDSRDRMRSRSRSRSFSPRSRKMPPDMIHHGHVGGHSGMKKMKPKDIPPHDHRMRPRSNSPMRRKMNKPMISGSNRSPGWRESNSGPVPKRRAAGNVGGGERIKSKKSGKRSGKKSGKTGPGKERSTSGSSASSGETSSSSRSASSSSTSTEGSSSSTSNATSSSDSSVPSIKLKPDKQKRKKSKRPSSKSESASAGKIQNKISSGSSIESGNLRDNRDLREKIKAKSRQNYEKMHDGTPTSDIRQQRHSDQYGSGSRTFNKSESISREHTPGDGRRRRPSATGSYEDGSAKRRRVLSPEYAPSPRRAPPPNDPPGQQGRRDRSPMQRGVGDRMRNIQSPLRRAPIEDRRNEGRGGEMGNRVDNYNDNSKHRDVDRYRDEGSFGRDNMMRQKDRMAPSRPQQHPLRSSQQERDRERGPGPLDNTPGGRFESRHPRPLLLLPQGVQAPSSHQNMPYNRSNVDDRVLRTTVHSSSPGATGGPLKHSPMIVKSKEALIEKYRGMKQSQYVDMWVDKTVEACGAPPTPNSAVSPIGKDNPSDPTKSEVPSPTTKQPMADIGELLSDFSDDDTELLNDVDEDPKSEKSVSVSTVPAVEKEKSSAAPVTGSGECDKEPATSATRENLPESKSASAQPQTPATPVTPLTPQDRKTMSTPQRTFLEIGREGQSLPSRSQTEDDILERMDFEEISDEELGDVAGENKIPIVDALGVDWASLVCGEKNVPSSPSASVLSASSSSMMKVRKRWTPLQVVSRVGLINNCSTALLQEIVQMKMKEEPLVEAVLSNEDDTTELEEGIQEELQNAGKFRKMRARENVIDTIGLGPNSRALSSRRDMALRRYYLGMPQKSLVSMDMLHQNSSTSNSVQDLESIGELYRLSLSLFKGSDSAAIIV